MADQPLTSLSESTSLSGDELVYAVDDPGGTPVDAKVKVQTLRLVPIETETGTTYTVVAADGGKVKRFTDAGLVTVTLPISVPVGTVVELLAYGAAGLDVVAGASATVRNAGAIAQYETVSALVVASDEWIVTGPTT